MVVVNENFVGKSNGRKLFLAEENEPLFGCWGAYLSGKTLDIAVTLSPTIIKFLKM